jgi:hypothetical protein
MRAIVRYSDGLIQFIHVPAYESHGGKVVELPEFLEVEGSDHKKAYVQLTRIIGREWHEIPEYVEIEKIETNN